MRAATQRLSRRDLLAGLASGASGFSVAIAWGIDGARSFGRAHVSVLGSGNDLSLLFADGPARLLLAAGDDPAAFGNALDKSLPIGRDRIDVLLLAGTANDLTFLSRAMRTANARHVEVAAKPETVGRLALPLQTQMPAPRRFRLSANTHVIVETLDRGPDSPGPSFAWRALVEHGASRILTLSDGRLAADFPDAGRVSAIVVNGDAIADALRAVEARVVVASARAISGKALRDHLADSRQGPLWSLRVHAGNAVRFDFTDRGLRLPVGVERVDTTAIGPTETPSAR